jgi:hypothetical protein
MGSNFAHESRTTFGASTSPGYFLNMSTVTPLSHLSNFTLQTRQQHTSERRPGRKPADSAELIGQRSGRITCVDAMPPDDKRQSHVICLCDCGRASSPRASDFAGGKSGSCKCHKIELFKAYHRQRAENLSVEVCRAIFLDSCRTGSWPGADVEIAKRHGVHPHSVRSICALHKERLAAKHGETISSHRFPLRIQRNDLNKGLDLIEFNWLMKHTPNHDDNEGLVLEWDDVGLGLLESIAKYHPEQLPASAWATLAAAA